MLRKIGKWAPYMLFVTLLLGVLAMPARAVFDNALVNDKTDMKYNVSGTECYVSWNFGFTIFVKYVNLTHAFGNLTYWDSNADPEQYKLLPNGDNISLSIYVIRSVTDWKLLPNINNITPSQLLEHWNSTYVNTGDTGLYEDTTRNTVSINFTLWTGDVWQNFRIAWDNDTGVLVEYKLVQTHPTDLQFSGTWSITLIETSLWGITTEGIPGYPIGILLITGVAGIYGVFLSKKHRRCTN